MCDFPMQFTLLEGRVDFSDDDDGVVEKWILMTTDFHSTPRPSSGLVLLGHHFISPVWVGKV